MKSERELIHEGASRILANDPALADRLPALKALERHPAVRPALERIAASPDGLEGLDEQLVLETIVSRVGRPVLAIQNDDYAVTGPESEVWQARLGQPPVRPALLGVIPSVGRIELDNHADYTWVGTGWLLSEDVVVTNRHVAEVFAMRSGDGFVFRRGSLNRRERMKSRVDFKEERDTPSPREFDVVDILHIEDDDGPDMAFLRVSRTGPVGSLTTPLRLARQAATGQQFVATIGYPAADSRVPDQELVRRLFGDVYNVKRLAPGQVLRADDDLVRHDCSTLGGNSGSPIIDLNTGEAVGLHFSGLFLQENRGVPAALIADRLQRLGRIQPVRPIENPPKPKTGAETGAPVQGVPVQATTVQAVSVGWTIPVHVTVALGPLTATSAGATASLNAPPGTPAAALTGPVPIEAAVAEARRLLGGRSDVLAVRDGYVFRDGWITDEPAVVVVMRDPDAASAGAPGIPAQIAGFRVEVRPPGPSDFIESMDLDAVLEGFPRTTYTPPENVELKPVEQKMRVICHVCPDAGWPTLRGFLSQTQSRLTIGMYDFTAPHIVEAVLRAVEDNPRRLALVLQKEASLGGGTKKHDIPEEKTIARYLSALGDRFDFEWASIGKNRRFASAYHIKVLVRDGKAFWLSSGNWQSSNQPNHELADKNTPWNLLMEHNREWNAVVENAALAEQFEKFLRHDLKQAKEDAGLEAVPVVLEFLVEEAPLLERVPPGSPTYFAPLDVNRKVRVTPLLTPDNYQEQVLALINSAEEQILFQNQSFSILDEPKNDARFTALFDALLAQQKRGLDVRIIIRGEFDAHKYVEKLKKKGFDVNRVRLQDRCHTKGIIVDRRRVLVGSHNWTNQGTVVNRDASLIFDDAEIAAYFAEIFWFDWKKLARQSVGRPRRIRLADTREAPTGMLRVPWHSLLLD